MLSKDLYNFIRVNQFFFKKIRKLTNLCIKIIKNCVFIDLNNIFFFVVLTRFD